MPLRVPRILLPWLFVAPLACSSLPDYASPTGGVVDPSQIDRSDLITYRKLEQGDFRAESPPVDAAEHAQKLGALTCSYVVTTPGTRFEMEERPGKGDATFRAKLKELGFVAYMDRNCSWWNPKDGIASKEYVLQHEQIHFALTEVASRRLNARVPQLMKTIRAETRTAEQATELMQKALSDLLDETMDELLARNQDFDEDTSAKHDAKAQQKWFDEVSAELDELPPASD